jgi:hypothetical protein
MIVISVVVHAAFQRLPQLAKPASVWLIQALVAWCDAHNVTSDIMGGDRNQTFNHKV